MATESKTVIAIVSSINAPVEKVWKYWTSAEHIMQWNNASDDWHTTRAENDLRVGGKFMSRMEAKDGSMGFDFGGIYDVVCENKYMEYTMDDGRKVKISFISKDGCTEIEESFEAESTNPVEMQRTGWQNILDNFKHYIETN